MKSLLTIQQQALGVQHDLVSTLRQRRRDLSRCLQFSQLQETLVTPDRLTNQLCAPSFTLRPDNDTLLLLDRLVDQERRPLRNLLCDLLGLYGVCKLGRECDVRDGDVVQDEIEPTGPAHEVFTDETRDHFSLGDELGCVELGHDGFEDFVYDRREDAFVVVGAEFTVTAMLDDAHVIHRTDKTIKVKDGEGG